jgi:hypothetical protein
VKLVRRTRAFFKIRETARKEISDLTLLAEFLPEDQLKQFFTEERLLPLFNAILLGYKSPLEIDEKGSLKLDEKGNVKVVNIYEKLPMNEELEKRRERLLPLCFQVISLLDDHDFSELLAGLALRTAAALESSLLAGLRAIYYRSMITENKK